MDIDNLLLECDDLLSDIDILHDSAQKEVKEIQRVIDVMDRTPVILDDLDREFCKKTALTTMDMNFLMVAIGLQIARQYLLTKFPNRLDDQSAADSTLGHIKEHSDRMHRYYNPGIVKKCAVKKYPKSKIGMYQAT